MLLGPGPHLRAANKGYFWAGSTTSYGSYSGAVPNGKITWGKLGRTRQIHHQIGQLPLAAPLVLLWWAVVPLNTQ
jgi:hypothetical protein